MRKLQQQLLLITTLLTMLAIPAWAIFDDYNHPEIKWVSFETDHFILYFAPGLEDMADMAAKVAEEIHEPLCILYDYRPDTKVSLIFSDVDDIANAASYFQSNKIHFYATSMSWDFRGTHNWLRNVVTHEYTHMIQLGASRKWSRRVPAFYMQVLDYEPERRPDVLYGYPNKLVSWPLPSVTVPAWFAEGAAQYQFDGNNRDYWDSHRDMLLRQATLSRRLLSFEDMAYFGKTSLESEGVYNQGFSFVKYIAEKTGDPKTLERISHQLSLALPVPMNSAMKRATGKSGEDWYREWKTDLERKYGEVHRRLKPELSQADTVPGGGFVNLYPRISPDGKRIAYISNQKRDYFGQTSLYVYSLDSAKTEKVAPAAQGGLAWLPDNSAILFAREGVRSNGSMQYDLYLYRFKDKKEFRLSKGLRCESVDLSSDGKRLALTINEQGRREIAIAKMPVIEKKIAMLTKDSLLFRMPSLPHEQYYLPRWSPDGQRIAVAQHREDGRSLRIFRVQEDGKSLTLDKEYSGERLELRDPSWSEDGKSLFASWDVSGISNIYRINLENDQREQWTSVLGGAFYPEARGNRLVYSEFCEKGFRICYLNNPVSIRNSRETLDDREAYSSRVPKPQFSLTAERHASKLYKPVFESLYWFPRLTMDYGTFKPGTYLLLNDVLEKLNFFGGFAMNQKLDYDLFGIVEYRALYPTIFAEYYNVQRRLSSEFENRSVIDHEEGSGPDAVPVYERYRIRFRYSLNEADIGVKIPVGGKTSVKLSGIYNRYIAHNTFDDASTVGITYFKGWAGKLGVYSDFRLPGILSEINPRGGYKYFFEYTRANHLFYTDLQIGGDAVGLKEIYAPYNYGMYEAGVEKYFSLPGWDHSFELRGRGGFVDRHVDPFFFLYAGGLPGMRGYSYYSMGGERTAVGTATYRFPIVKRAAWNLWPLSVNQIFGSVFMDVGDAWSRGETKNHVKKDIGAGLRFKLHSFYSYPTAVAFDAAYGFDKFSVRQKENSAVTEYGQEMRYYLTVLFNFYSPFSSAETAGHSFDSKKK